MQSTGRLYPSHGPVLLPDLRAKSGAGRGRTAAKAPDEQVRVTAVTIQRHFLQLPL